jgi:hypothetical protein
VNDPARARLSSRLEEISAEAAGGPALFMLAEGAREWIDDNLK